MEVALSVVRLVTSHAGIDGAEVVGELRAPPVLELDRRADGGCKADHVRVEAHSHRDAALVHERPKLLKERSIQVVPAAEAPAQVGVREEDEVPEFVDAGLDLPKTARWDQTRLVLLLENLRGNPAGQVGGDVRRRAG